MEHNTPGFARILKEYGSVSWDSGPRHVFFHAVEVSQLELYGRVGKFVIHLNKNVNNYMESICVVTWTSTGVLVNETNPKPKKLLPPNLNI